MTDGLKYKVTAVFLAAGRFVLNVIYIFHKIFPVRNRISIVSRQSEEPYADLIMLSEELRRQDPDLEVVISCRMIGKGLSGKCRYALHLVTQQMHLFATSRVVILDTYCISASMLKHKKKLKIVQMWHAMGAFKCFGYSAVDEAEGRSRVLAEGMRMHRNYDVVFVSSEACRAPMAASFGCDPGIMEVMPLPRTDLLKDAAFMEETAQRIRNRYPQLCGKRVVLYAPTFRKNGMGPAYAKRLIDAADYETSCLAVKLHPLDQGRIIAKHAIIDSDFSSQEWLSVADDVITDYSAFIFEAAAAGKNIYQYVPDDADYDRQRGFLIDLDTEFPFFRSADAARVIREAAACSCDPQKRKAFADKYVQPGENHTEHMAEFILHLAEEKASL